MPRFNEVTCQPLFATAFTTVEINVRDGGGFTIDDYGTDLMRKAFHERTGSLTDQGLPKAERESFAHLFAGALGAYKNPHSHRKATTSVRLNAKSSWPRTSYTSWMPR
jgi:hypothetical protein